MNKIKQFFKGKKGKELTKQVPRPLEEIKKQHDSVAYQAGMVQYEIEIKKAQLDQLNRVLLQLNQEADQRQQLDASAKKVLQEQAQATALKEQNEANKSK